MKELGKLKKKYSCIGDIRGSGLFIGIEIVKKDSRFCLDAPGFEDSFSAANFTRNLPSSLSNYQILVDSIPEIYYQQKYEYKILD